jgi:hypothetical protein
MIADKVKDSFRYKLARHKAEELVKYFSQEHFKNKIHPQNG